MSEPVERLSGCDCDDVIRLTEKLRDARTVEYDLRAEVERLTAERVRLHKYVATLDMFFREFGWDSLTVLTERRAVNDLIVAWQAEGRQG